GLQNALPTDMVSNEGLIGEALSAWQRISTKHPHARVNSLQRAKYISLRSRSEAAAEFAGAVAEAGEMLNSLMLDFGAATYFSAQEVEGSNNIAADISQ